MKKKNPFVTYLLKQNKKKNLTKNKNKEKWILFNHWKKLFKLKKQIFLKQINSHFKIITK